MKNYIKNNYKQIIFKILLIVAVLVIDIVTKIVFANVFQNRYANENFDNIIFIKNIISFTYTENIGAAFSMFSGNVVFLIIFSLVFIGVFVSIDIMYKEKSWWFVTGFSLILGGAIGNLVDRIFLGYVRDFISFDFLKNFAICNIADVCITVGCCLMVVYFILLLVNDRKLKLEKLINESKKENNYSCDYKLDNKNIEKLEDSAEDFENNAKEDK